MRPTEWRVADAKITIPGLTSDDQNLHEERIKLWNDFNHAWLAIFQRQKEMMESGQQLQRTQTLISPEGLKKMGKSLVKYCDIIERYGLVDYQYGVWEEQIIDSMCHPAVASLGRLGNVSLTIAYQSSESVSSSTTLPSNQPEMLAKGSLKSLVAEKSPISLTRLLGCCFLVSLPRPSSASCSMVTFPRSRRHAPVLRYLPIAFGFLYPGYIHSTIPFLFVTPG
jgi:hypothetical protein